MITSRFGEIQLGDQTVHYLFGCHRLVKTEQPLLWSTVGHIDDSSPGWITEIQLSILIGENTIHDLNNTLHQLLGQLTPLGLSDLVIADDPEETTIVTYPDCRFDQLLPRQKGPFEPGKLQELFTLTFTTISDPVTP